MRFSVLVVFVATFVVSCSSFISAETEALDDNLYDKTEVARRLRGEKEVEEEERAPFFRKGDENLQLKGLKSFDEYTETFTTKNRIKLEGKNGEKVNMKALLDNYDPVEMQKLVLMATKASKGKEGFFKKTIKYGLMAAGVVGLLYVLYCWGFKAAPNTTADSTATSGTTTAASANSGTAGGA